MSENNRLTIRLGKSWSSDNQPGKWEHETPMPIVVKIDGGATEWHTDSEGAVNSISDLLKYELSQGRQITIETREFPMTDGPDIPWSLAEEIYISDAFSYFEDPPPGYESDELEKMAEKGGWSWRALGDCFETYSAQCDYEAACDAKLEQRAEAYHA